MKRKPLLLSLLSFLFVISATAQQKKDLEKDITMVSYEQSWLDSNGALSLKNNTDKEIKNVVFVISYLDMNGNELDYEEFTKQVSINPGMTKKLDIPAYEHDRMYHYYKTKDEFGHPAFKISFKLKDYNIDSQQAIKKDKNDKFDFDRYYNEGSNKTDDNGNLYLILFIVGLLLYVGIGIGLYVLVAVMAQKRNREVIVWVILSLFISPLITCLILLCVGKDEDRNPHY